MSGQENARQKFVGPNVGAGKYRTGKCGTVTCRTGKKDHGCCTGCVVNVFT